MRRLKAFLVEDNAALREQLISALDELGEVDVVGVADGEAEANAWLADNASSCELVIIDLFLTNGSGIGVLSAARDLGGSRSLVMLTNFASAGLRAGCQKLGATRVFDKSTEIEDLVAFCATLRVAASAE